MPTQWIWFYDFVDTRHIYSIWLDKINNHKKTNKRGGIMLTWAIIYGMTHGAEVAWVAVPICVVLDFLMVITWILK